VKKPGKQKKALTSKFATPKEAKAPLSEKVTQASEGRGYPLPTEVSHVIAASRAENFGLLFHRLLRYPAEWQLEGKQKSDTWDTMVKSAQWIYQQLESASDPRLLQSILGRFSLLEQAYGRQGYCFSRLEARVVWRLTIGLGTASTLDTGLALHRIYGIPYIPGSAVKGLTRAYCLTQIANALGVPRMRSDQIKKWEDNKLGPTPWQRLELLLMTRQRNKPESIHKELERRWKSLVRGLELLQQSGMLGNIKIEEIQRINLDDLNRLYVAPFSRIFGSTNAQGEVLFFDAFPMSLMINGQPILELDIINPHYGPYYTDTDGQPPADWHDPRPVNFLALRKDTRFIFTLACRDKDLLNQAKSWLRSASQEFGIGAKTRAGYGELTEASAQSLGGTARATLSAATADPTPSLETAIARWHARDMGTLPQLIEQLSKIPDAARRQQLAHQLQQKLKEAGKWTRNSQSKPWYQTLEKLMGGSPSEPSQS
jgi:CRISPR-associated protein Cmr6